jgi:hypothetical protein
MYLRGIAWLSQRIPDFGALLEKEKEAIQDFSMLWSFFEGTKLDGKANITAIRKYIKSIKSIDSLYRLNVADYLEYLRNRYFANGSFTGFYSDLHLEKTKGAAEIVDRMLQSNSISKADELIGCLTIIYRLRNNLFHGDKWHYQLQGQYDNFMRANELLMAFME